MLHSLSYSYRHRRERKGDFRQLWITRINAAARAEGLSYSQFMNGLNKSGIEIDRKMLAEMAVRDMPTFSKVLAVAREEIRG
jgi:large subunit ribosomal protein L20